MPTNIWTASVLLCPPRKRWTISQAGEVLLHTRVDGIPWTNSQAERIIRRTEDDRNGTADVIT